MTRHRPLLLMVVAAVIAAMLAAPTATANASPRVADTGSKAGPRGGHDAARAARAARALTEAQALFTTKAHPRAALLHGPDATIVLNRLMRLRSALTGDQRVEADRLLARPTDPVNPVHPETVNYTTAEATPDCGATACVHYVTSTADAPNLADTSPANGIPDYVDLALATVEGIHDTYVDAGYNPPEDDGTLGGNGKIDIYLAEVGSKGLYGYCTSDKSFAPTGPGTAGPTASSTTTTAAFRPIRPPRTSR